LILCIFVIPFLTLPRLLAGEYKLCDRVHNRTTSAVFFIRTNMTGNQRKHTAPHSAHEAQCFLRDKPCFVRDKSRNLTCEKLLSLVQIHILLDTSVCKQEKTKKKHHLKRKLGFTDVSSGCCGFVTIGERSSVSLAYGEAITP